MTKKKTGPDTGSDHKQEGSQESGMDVSRRGFLGGAAVAA